MKKYFGFRLSSSAVDILDSFKKNKGQNMTETIENALVLYQAVELSKGITFKQEKECLNNNILRGGNSAKNN